MSGVTLKQLRALAVLARERNFARAAARLHVTPPTLTASIKALEDGVGLRLFDRSTRAVAPTTHTRRFLPVVERILEDLDRAVAELRDEARLHTGSVVAAGATSFIAYVIAPAVARLAGAHPGIRVRLVEATLPEARRRVLEAEADFAVSTLTGPDPALDTVRLLADRLGIVCAADHPLAAARGPVPVGAIAAHPCVGLDRANGITMLLEADARLPPSCRRPAYEVSDVPLLEPLLARGVGVALLPALAARPITRAGLVFRPLAVAIRRPVSLLLPRGRSLAPAARALLRATVEELQRLREDQAISVLATSAGVERFLDRARA